MTQRESRAVPAIVGGGAGASATALPDTGRSLGTGVASLLSVLQELWNRVLAPPLRALEVAGGAVGRAMLRSVSFVGPNPYLQTLVFTTIVGVAIGVVFLFFAVAAGPLSGRWRGPNPLEPPRPSRATESTEVGSPSSSAAAPEAIQPEAGTRTLEVPPTPENRSKLLHTAGALRELVRLRPGPDRVRSEVDLLRAEDLIVTNRLTEAYVLLDQISEAVSARGRAGMSDMVPGPPERWTGSPTTGPRTPESKPRSERWTGAPPSKRPSRPLGLADGTG